MRAQCPVCGRQYETKLNREHPELLIQDEHPDAKLIEREQLVTCICSDECWDEMLVGGDDYDE